MKYGISLIATIPVRKDPAESSEMETQILFGETFEILEEKPRWFCVRIDYDGHEGWIDWKMATLISDDLHLKCKKSFVLTSDPFCLLNGPRGPFYVSLGSSLPLFDSKRNILEIDDRCFEVKGNIWIPPTEIRREEMVNLAYSFLGAPYLWGGKCIMGIDCSGFTQVVYKAFGIVLLRNAFQQATQGNVIANLEETLPGDLAFFEKNGKITHVGIVLKDNQIIHSSGCVRIDQIDSKGIFNVDRNEYSHQLFGFRRILDDVK
ncbi:MAG: C40 family peptidase [Bacteroidota bacterium]|nr:C40 family peptidase [Bacteroidota bacterium]